MVGDGGTLGACQGTSSINQPVHATDASRLKRFRRLLVKIPGRVLIRGAVDNSFALVRILMAITRLGD